MYKENKLWDTTPKYILANKDKIYLQFQISMQDATYLSPVISFAILSILSFISFTYKGSAPITSYHTADSSKVCLAFSRKQYTQPKRNYGNHFLGLQCQCCKWSGLISTPRYKKERCISTLFRLCACNVFNSIFFSSFSLEKFRSAKAAQLHESLTWGMNLALFY